MQLCPSSQCSCSNTLLLQLPNAVTGHPRPCSWQVHPSRLTAIEATTGTINLNPLLGPALGGAITTGTAKRNDVQLPAPPPGTNCHATPAPCDITASIRSLPLHHASITDDMNRPNEGSYPSFPCHSQEPPPHACLQLGPPQATVLKLHIAVGTGSLPQ